MIQVFSTRKDKPRAYKYGEYNHQLSFDPIELSISPDGKKWTSIFDIPDLKGVYCAKAPDVRPANQTVNYRKIAIQDGQRLLSSSYDQRDFTATFFTDESIDEPDTLLGFDALQRFLVSRKPYWICFANWPQRMYYVVAKFGTPVFYADRGWSVELTFTDVIGLSRSISTSLDYKNRVIGFGNNEPLDKDTYTFNVNTSPYEFKVNNISDVKIDPERRGHEFIMTCDGTSKGKMKITNKTTGDELNRLGMTTTGQDNKTVQGKSDFKGKFVLNGVRTTLDGKSDTLQNDQGVITLDKGINEFQIENFTGKVTFDFPFWWLS